MVKSLATGKTDYVDVRIRRTDTCILHLQGKGVRANRDYGVAGNISVTPEFASWVNKLPTSSSSLAGTGRKYAYAQVSIRGDQLHFQVQGIPFDGTGTRGYGAVLDIPVANFYDLADFVSANKGQDFDVNNDDDEDCCHNHDCCNE